MRDEGLGIGRRDPAIENAIARLRAFFDESPRRLFYSTQIETYLEREFFHWIVGKGLLEMAESGQVQRTTFVVQQKEINFYAQLQHRYWRRELREITGLLERIFEPEFTHAIGRHGELMFDAALARVGFQIEAVNANSWNGRAWLETNHNLDRIVTKDGFQYGIEIKNTQNYIQRDELELKIRLCQNLGLTPLFIMRFAPKSYVHKVAQNGGFVLLFEDQIYPLGHNALIVEVRARLGLKVHCPNAIPEGHINRFLNWHDRRRSA